MNTCRILLLAVLATASAACSRNTAPLMEVNKNVPAYAVMAHRGSTYWAPEETESAWRWAREMGADYLESDLQCTKDGVILANHDDNLTRTTNIEEVFGAEVPATRRDFYLSLGFPEADADAQLAIDREGFKPYYAASYYYAELLMLDAGSWFNAARPEQARPAYAGSQYVSALQDQIAYAEGKADGKYFGLKYNQFIGMVDRSGFIVKQVTALKQLAAEREKRDIPVPPAPPLYPDDLDDIPPGPWTPPVTPPPMPEQPKNRHFGMTVTLDNTRVVRNVGNLMDEVINHLMNVDGAKVEIRLLVDAIMPDGTPAPVVRTVTENCRTLYVEH